MPAPAPRPCNRLLPTLQIQAEKASDSLRHRRRGRGADLRTGSWPQGRSASPPELARLPDAEDTRDGVSGGGPAACRVPRLLTAADDARYGAGRLWAVLSRLQTNLHRTTQRVIMKVRYQPRANRIAEYVQSHIDDVVLIPQRSVVEAPLPEES